MERKEVLRKEMLQRLRNQKPETRNQKSNLIKNKLFSLKEFKKAKILMCYISLNTEVDTREIIKHALKLGKRVFAPIIEGDRLGISELKDLDEDLERGPLKILQPKKRSLRLFSPAGLDVAVIPGLGFDKEGQRLGRGKGYFDRFLKELPKTVNTVGLAFDFQILESIPVSSHDIPVDFVISN